jgi:hypothetical protein
MGTVPAIPTFQAGQVVSSANMNLLGTAITWRLSGRPLAQCQQLSAQSIANTTVTALTWDTNLENRDSMWSSGSNSRLTVATPGIFLAAANVTYAAASGGARQIWFRVTTGSSNPAGSGVTIPFGMSALNNAGGSLTSAVATKFLTPYMYDGDYLQVLTYQNQGAAVSTQPLAADQGPMLLTMMHVSG